MGTYRIAYKIDVPSYPTIPFAISAPFKLTIIDPCFFTKLVLSSPFSDVTYNIGDPRIDITWLSDASLGRVAIDPKSCGAFTVSFWLLNESNVPIKDVTTPLTIP